MERRHRQILTSFFPLAIAQKSIIVLDIADDYRLNDPELIDMLQLSLADYL